MAPEDEQLYVRINQQERMLEDLEKLESVIENINEASDILEQVREVKVTAIDTIFSNIQEINETLEDFEMSMPDVEGQAQLETSVPDREEGDVEVESSVDEIHDELQDLQRELSQLGSN
jgi:uncharacterized protein YoxC